MSTPGDTPQAATIDDFVAFVDLSDVHQSRSSANVQMFANEGQCIPRMQVDTVAIKMFIKV